MTHSIMFQGTGSDVGKTVLVAGFCRLASNRGLKVMPFKPQNMSNNAAVAYGEDKQQGEIAQGEIGRGQWLQAIAARVRPSIHMNPVLLKPQSDVGSQVIVQGKVWGQAKGRDYKRIRGQLLDAVTESYQKISSQCDLVIVEGAGSPAEINLRAGDIANMGFATHVNVPVILVGDIDRGGVIASLVGTHTILHDVDRDMIKGFLINKFRGDVSLFDDGLTAITGFTGWQSLGVVPWLKSVQKLPAEDSVALDHMVRSKSDAKIKVAVPVLPRIANFDDLDPLIAEPDVEVIFVKSGEAFPEDADLIVLAGSKSTISDLQALYKEGWDQAILTHANQGGHVMGICGGYQMLGHKILDPDGIEGTIAEIDGLGLLNIETIMAREKTVQNTKAMSLAFETPLEGYEIHMGRTSGDDCNRPFAKIDDHFDGAMNGLRNVMGTYLHGVFTSDGYRHALLKTLGLEHSHFNYRASLDAALDELADELDRLIDFDHILDIAASK